MTTKLKALHSVKRVNAVDEVIEQVKQALIDGELRPGERLPSESQLVEQLGVGRGTVREATKMLSAMGVLDIRQGDGTYVAKSVSPQAINPLLFAVLLETQNPDDLFEFREMLDMGFFTIAAAKGTDADFDKIEASIRSMSEYVSCPDIDFGHVVQLDLEFHSLVLAATKNPLIMKVGQILMEMLRETMRLTVSYPGGVERTIHIHQTLLDALRSRDEVEVREAVFKSKQYPQRIA